MFVYMNMSLDLYAYVFLSSSSTYGWLYVSPIVLCVVYAACVHELGLGLENKANALVYTGICISSAIMCITSSHIYMGYKKTSLDLYVFIMRVCLITLNGYSAGVNDASVVSSFSSWGLCLWDIFGGHRVN